MNALEIYKRLKTGKATDEFFSIFLFLHSCFQNYTILIFSSLNMIFNQKDFFLYFGILMLNSDSERWQLLRMSGKDKISQESVKLVMTCLCNQPERGETF